jgi:hypothetical protein
VNDLDLEVTLPAPADGTNATTVLGNSMYRLGSQLLSSDGRDRINNVEVSSLLGPHDGCICCIATSHTPHQL